MSIQELTPEEIDCVYGGKGSLGKMLNGCFVAGDAAFSTAGAGHGWQGAGAGCMVGAALGAAGASNAALMAAGYAVGAGFGPYGGSSTSATAANYENSFDRQDSQRRMTST